MAAVDNQSCLKLFKWDSLEADDSEMLKMFGTAYECSLPKVLVKMSFDLLATKVLV